MYLQIKGGPLLQKQLVHNATISNIVPRWQTFEAWQFDLQVNLKAHTQTAEFQTLVKYALVASVTVSSIMLH